MYVYIHSETNEYGQWLYTVGFYSPDGKWNPDSDHDTKESAAERVNYLNGGTQEKEQVSGSYEDYQYYKNTHKVS